MSEFVEVFIESDDDTYIYGDYTYKVKIVDGVYIEPYMLELDNNFIKFYRNEGFFAVYTDNILTDIIFIETCWSGDVIGYKINENMIGHEFLRVYHGRQMKENKNTRDLSELIKKFDLMG